MEAHELGAFETSGLVIGSAGVNEGLQIVGISQADSANIIGVATIFTTVDDKQIAFNTTASTFHWLVAQADNGIVVHADITTTYGAMYLDADSENSSSSDGFNRLSFSNARTLNAKTTLTLESTTGGLIRDGDLTLQAGRGIVIHDSLTGGLERHLLVLHAGYDLMADGSVQLAANKRIDTGSKVLITAMDIDLLGGIQAGNSTLVIHTAGAGRQIGVGISSQQMHIDATEIQRVTSTGLSIGGADSGTITVGGVSVADSNGIVGLISLLAIADDAKVVFLAQQSMFAAVAAIADNGIEVGSNMVTLAGHLILDGDADDSGTDDNNNKIIVSGNQLLEAFDILTLDSTSGGIVRSGVGVLQLKGGNGIIINDDIMSANQGQQMVVSADTNADATGTLTVSTGKTVHSNDGAILITASDVDIGLLHSGTAVTKISVSKPALTIGLGATSKDLHISSPELQRITASGMILGNSVNGDAVIDGVKASESAHISSILTLLAGASNRLITFTRTRSTFNSLAAQAANGVNVNSGLTSVVGDITVDGDSDTTRTGNFADRVTIASDMTLTSQKTLTIDSLSGGITHVGQLTLNARDGVVLNDNMDGQQIERGLRINADSESDGIGSFTLKSGITVDSKHSIITITAADIDVFGSLTSGTQAISLHASGVNRTIAIGSTTQDMHLADSEIGHISSNGLIIGTQHNGDILINGVQDSSTSTIATLTLVATKHQRFVKFASTVSSFNKGIVVQAMSGIVVEESVTTKNTATVLSAGTGTFTVFSSRTMLTTNQDLVITADDIDLRTGAAIDAGSAVVSITTQSPRTMGVGGAGTEQMNIELPEMANIFAAGLTIGRDGSPNRDIKVDGVPASASAGITEFVSLIAAVDDSRINFVGSASTFAALGAQADNGITVDTTIITTSSYMHLNGDVDRSNNGDDDNSITFADGLTISAQTVLTLEGQTGSIIASKSLTLKANSGIVILNDLQVTGSDSQLIFNADDDSSGDGVFTIATSKSLNSNSGTIEITAADVDFGGSVQSTLLAIQTSVPDGPMALGTRDANHTVSTDELQNIVSTQLVFGKSTNGDITVSGVTARGSNNIAGMVCLIASRDDATVGFVGTGSTFNSLAVQADSGMDIQVDLSADVGILLLNGDSDNSDVADVPNHISLTGQRTIRSEGLFTIEGLIYRSGGMGATTFRSGTGIVLDSSMASATSGQSLVLDSDDHRGVWSAADTSGVGVLTVTSGEVINTNSGELFITASDLDLQGGLNSGNSTLLLTVSRRGSILGVGATLNTASGFTISGTEMQRMTSTGLNIGNIINSSIEVDGVTAANSAFITGIVSLTATNQNAAVTFTGAGSTFSALSVSADDGIDIFNGLTSLSGSIYLDGDADNFDDQKSRDFINFGYNLALTSALDIDLKASTGGIKLAGPVQFIANRHISIHNKFTGPFGSHSVIVHGDADNDGVGVVSVASAACSVYANAASCVASRLCGWCGSEAKTIGNGLISTWGGAGTNLNASSVLSDDPSFVSGNLIHTNGQSRKIISVSGSSATIATKFYRVASGSLSVFSGAMDQVVGSTKNKFDTELRPGYTITANGLTREVASVTSHKAFTLTTAFGAAASHTLFTIGNILGSGMVSTDSGLSATVTGSWPPKATRFLTQLKAGSYITVGSETRIVASVISNQLLTVTTPFSASFSSNVYNISNIAGTGTLSWASNSLQVDGSDLSSTAFTTELRVGDIISVIINGLWQTKMVQTIIDDFHLSVSSIFSTTLTNVAFQIGNVHDSSFTIASKGTGSVYTNGVGLLGYGTKFGAELENGFNVVVEVGGVYYSRKVMLVHTDTAISLDAPLPGVIFSNSTVEFHYQTCPDQAPEVDASEPGTFSMHAKSSRPPVCFSTGRCVPKASHSEQFEAQGTGTIAGATTSNIVSGANTDFTTQLQYGYSISIATAAKMESRKVISVTSATTVVVEHPFSFDITPATNQGFLIHRLSGRGTISNSGGANYTIVGTATQFKRDVEVGFVIAVGSEKRVVTSISNDGVMAVNAPFNYLHGGVSNTNYAYEACLSGAASTVKQFTVDYALLEPGCCGFKAVGAVSGGDFAYYKVIPPSTNYNLRVVTTASIPQLEIYMRYSYAPDAVNYDFKAVSTYSPWQIELPQNKLRCPTSSASCDPLWIGVKGLAGGGSNIKFEMASYLEFNFPSFACSESLNTTLSAKCQSLGLYQVADASFTADAADPNNMNVMRLTSSLPSQSGAVWYSTKMHLENGFETLFKFKMSSKCSESGASGCGAGDGFAFVMYGGSAPDAIGCPGRSLGFASDALAALSNSTCSGIPQSFAIEFDTWHNPELRDINIRGVGTVEVNASVVPRYNYVHTAFFSNGEAANTNSHDTQLAGTPAIPAINDGNVHTARVVYIPGTSSSAPGRLFLYIDDMQSFALTAPVRFTREGSCGTATTDRCILDVFGNAYMGFTAATGEVGQAHDVSQWLFCDEPGCGRGE